MPRADLGRLGAERPWCGRLAVVASHGRRGSSAGRSRAASTGSAISTASVPLRAMSTRARPAGATASRALARARPSGSWDSAWLSSLPNVAERRERRLQDLGRDRRRGAPRPMPLSEVEVDVAVDVVHDVSRLAGHDERRLVVGEARVAGCALRDRGSRDCVDLVVRPRCGARSEGRSGRDLRAHAPGHASSVAVVES